MASSCMDKEKVTHEFLSNDHTITLYGLPAAYLKKNDSYYSIKNNANHPSLAKKPSTAAAIATKNRRLSGEECKRLIKKLLILAFTVTIIEGFFIAALIWSIPAKPDIKVVSMWVSPIDIFNSKITANWTIALDVRNPHEGLPIDYFEFEVAVLYDKEEFLCMTRVPEFHQGPKDQTTLIAEPKAWLQRLSNDRIASRIHADLCGHHGGVVLFDVKLRLRIRDGVYNDADNKRSYKPRFRPDAYVNMLCSDVEVQFLSNEMTTGSMLGGSTRCAAI